MPTWCRSGSGSVRPRAGILGGDGSDGAVASRQDIGISRCETTCSADHPVAPPTSHVLDEPNLGLGVPARIRSSTPARHFIDAADHHPCELHAKPAAGLPRCRPARRRAISPRPNSRIRSGRNVSRLTVTRPKPACLSEAACFCQQHAVGSQGRDRGCLDSVRACRSASTGRAAEGARPPVSRNLSTPSEVKIPTRRVISSNVRSTAWAARRSPVRACSSGTGDCSDRSPKLAGCRAGVEGVGDHFSTHDPLPFALSSFFQIGKRFSPLRLRSGTRQRLRRGEARQPRSRCSPHGGNQPEAVFAASRAIPATLVRLRQDSLDLVDRHRLVGGVVDAVTSASLRTVPKKTHVPPRSARGPPPGGRRHRSVTREMQHPAARQWRSSATFVSFVDERVVFDLTPVQGGQGSRRHRLGAGKDFAHAGDHVADRRRSGHVHRRAVAAGQLA